MNIHKINTHNITFERKIKKHKITPLHTYNMNKGYKEDLLIKTNQIAANKKAKTAMKKLSNKQRTGAILSAIGLTAIIGTSILIPEGNRKETTPQEPENQFPIIINNSEKENINLIPKQQNVLPTKKGIQFIRGIEKESIKSSYFFEQAPDDELLKDTSSEEKINKLNQLLEENPELKDAYEDITSAVERFSEDMGEDGYKLINKYIEEYGDGKVDKTDVYKMLYIESRGKVYDDDGNILESECHAFGPFQITGITEEGTNERFETDFDKKNPYDNIALHVLILRHLYEYRTKQIAEGESLPTGDNIKHAIIWGYHDGAYADYISSHCEDYIETFDRLSKLDEYPELYDLMEGNLKV